MNTEDMQASAEESGTDMRDLLDPRELRVLAVLAEKEALTPDSYPLSLNALVNGCNQLSSRDPVMTLSESDVQQTLQRLIAEKFVAEVNQAGARVAKYQHRLRVKWSLEQDKLAVLTILMLRDVQTAGEIRARSGRLHEFASLTEVETCLQFLIDKYPPLVARLVRAPGAKEVRYAHLLSGSVSSGDSLVVVDQTSNVSSADRIAQLEEEVSLLREEINGLKEQFQQFKQQFE